MNTIEFNTGRQYSANGQVIRAKLIYNAGGNCGDVLFNDTARSIKGIIHNCHLSKIAILNRYDAGDYEWTSQNV